MRTKAEQLLARQLQAQPKLQKFLAVQKDIWTDDVLGDLSMKGYIRNTFIVVDGEPLDMVILLPKAQELATEEKTHEETNTYLSADWSSGISGGGRRTIQQDCDTCGSPGDERDEDAPPTGGGSR